MAATKVISEETSTETISQIGDSGVLSLDEVDWKPFYILSKCSIAQIMCSFRNILKVVPKNVYEGTLYARLKPAVEGLIECYNDILHYNNSIERDVKFYNLIVKLPFNVSINDQEDGHIRMKNAKIGKLVKACRQRIEFIQHRVIPQMYVNNFHYLHEFNKMKEELKGLLSTLRDFEVEFLEAIDEAHKAQQAVY